MAGLGSLPRHFPGVVYPQLSIFFFPLWDVHKVRSLYHLWTNKPFSLMAILPSFSPTHPWLVHSVENGRAAQDVNLWTSYRFKLPPLFGDSEVERQSSSLLWCTYLTHRSLKEWASHKPLYFLHFAHSEVNRWERLENQCSDTICSVAKQR